MIGLGSDKNIAKGIKFTKQELVSQLVSESVSHWQALPMIGLGSDKNEYLQVQPERMSRIKWFTWALNFTKNWFSCCFLGGLRINDKFKRNLDKLQASRLLNEVSLILQKDGIYKMSNWPMQHYFITFVSNSWELCKWHFVLYPSFLLCQFFLWSLECTCFHLLRTRKASRDLNFANKKIIRGQQ